MWSRIICCPSPENCWPHFTTRGFNVRSCTFQIQNKVEGVNPQNLEDADKHLPAARKACLLQGQNGVSHSWPWQCAVTPMGFLNSMSQCRIDWHWYGRWRLFNSQSRPWQIFKCKSIPVPWIKPEKGGYRTQTLEGIIPMERFQPSRSVPLAPSSRGCHLDHSMGVLNPIRIPIVFVLPGEKCQWYRHGHSWIMLGWASLINFCTTNFLFKFY